MGSIPSWLVKSPSRIFHKHTGLRAILVYPNRSKHKTQNPFVPVILLSPYRPLVSPLKKPRFHMASSRGIARNKRGKREAT